MATGAGVLVALAPTSALIGLLVWIGVVSITRYVSVASISAATLVPLSAWLTDEARSTVLFCAAIAIFVWWTHRDNLSEDWLAGRRTGSAAIVRSSAPPRMEGEGAE